MMDRAWPGGWTVEHVAVSASTNTELLESADHRPDRHALLADHQRAGRGRLDRRWESPPGENLLVSLLFHHVPGDAGDLSRRVSLAAVDASRALLVGPIEQGIDVRPSIRLKWPNDIVLGDAKLGGVLAQRSGSAVVVGIGVNVGWAPEGAARLGRGVSPSGLLAAMFAAYDKLPDGHASLMARYRDELETLGRRVRVERPTGDLVGTAVDLAEHGQLVVRDDAGLRHQLDVADVTHLRPA